MRSRTVPAVAGTGVALAVGVAAALLMHSPPEVRRPKLPDAPDATGIAALEDASLLSATAAPLSRETEHDALLSVFIWYDDDTCQWHRVDPIAGRAHAVLNVAGNCEAAQVAFSPDGNRAIVSFGVDGELTIPEDHSERMWEVTFESGGLRPLERPAFGDSIDILTYDASGSIVAVMETQVSDEIRDRGWIEVDGAQEYLFHPVPDRAGVLLQMFRLDEDGAWRRTNVLFTTRREDWSSARGEMVGARDLRPTTWTPLTPVALGDRVGDPRTLQALSSFEPTVEGYWTQFTVANEDVFDYALVDEHGAVWPGGAIVFRAGNGFVAAEGAYVKKKHAVILQRRGKYLLVTDTDGHAPRLYDVPARTLVYAENPAYGVTFWR